MGLILLHTHTHTHTHTHIALPLTLRGRDLVLGGRAVARYDPTIGEALVEGIILPPHPPFHSHALCIDHTLRTGPPVGV